MPEITDYKTLYSDKKNVNTMDRGSYTDAGDGTPSRQVHLTNPRLNTVSSKNSTDLTLLSDESFVGDFEETLGYSNISLLVTTDQDSKLEGLCIEWSSDGVTIDDVSCFYISPSVENKGKSFSFGVIAKYFRVIYNNSNTSQGHLRLQTILHVFRPKPSSHKIEGNITGENDAELVRSVITGRDSFGVFNNIGSVDGRLQVESVVVPQQLSERFRLYALNGTSREMNVNATLESPAIFTIGASALTDRVVDFISIQAFASGIKIDKFLGMNQELTNGILIEVKSEDKIFQFLPITNTTEFNSLFAFGPGRTFDLVFASGEDSMVSTFGPGSPFLLKRQGTYTTEDYIKVKIRDNISSTGRLRVLAGGRVS